MDKNLKPCFDTWSRQGKGFVCISTKYKDDQPFKERKWANHFFKWPQDQSKIEAFVDRNKGGADLYWAPLIFTKAKRDENLTTSIKTLFADLDPVDPRGLKIKPTVAWESSPGRYQALWWLDGEIYPTDHNKINQALTYDIGADHGGWDLTQVLRIPGTYNTKYEEPFKGKLLWYDPKTVYNRKKFDDIPSPSSGQSDSKTDTKALIELLSKYRKRIPKKVSTLLQYPDSRVEPGKRSDMLWYIESELVKAQIPLEDIVRMIAASSWNKYRGRRDEWKRLTTEISKIYDEAKQFVGVDDTEDDEEESDGLPFVTFFDMMSSCKSRPGYLIKDIWLRRSHGIVAGEPKTFKSTIALDIIVSVASGKPLWGKFPVEDPGPVMIIQNENSPWIIKDRMEKIISSKNLVGSIRYHSRRKMTVNFPPDLPIYFLNNFGYTFSDPLHREQLEQVIEEIKPVLIILDPLYLMFDGDINSAKELNPILSWLLSIKDDFDTAVMVIHHWKKSKDSSRGGQRMLGSTTLHGWIESALYMELQGDEEERSESVNILIEREMRGGGIQPKLAVQIKEGEFGNPFYEVELVDVNDKKAMSELLDLLSMYPSGLSTAQISKELGVSRRKVSEMAEKAGNQVRIKKGPKGSVIIKLNEGGS